MSVTRRKFGKTKDGEPVTLYTITNKMGNSVSIMDYGATVQSINIVDAEGEVIDCCLGYNTVAEYEEHTDFMGACIGRVGNRIGGSSFSLNGQTYTLTANEGENHLHGGLKGFDKQMFKAKIDSDDTVTFGRISPDGEEGYPGEFIFIVSYTFDDCDNFVMNYTGWNNSETLDTIASITNHTYFNLSGEDAGSVLDHTLELYASSFTEVDEHLIPTGKLLDVENTPFDFRKGKTLGQDINADHPQLKLAGGYDHNFCIDGDGMRPCCTLMSPKTRLKMYVSTDMPGVQIYTGNFISESEGKAGTDYHHHDGIAIETQFYPDALNHPEFPSPVLKPRKEYRYTTVYQFSADE